MTQEKTKAQRGNRLVKVTQEEEQTIWRPWFEVPFC